MKIFISYARVDKAICVGIANLISAYDVWYDCRLAAGQNWWKEILKRLEWCDVFLYLLSPSSLQSSYCEKEYFLAREAGKRILPILIEKAAQIPNGLRDIQYIDMSEGQNAENVSQLLNSLAIHNEQIHYQEHARTTDKPTELNPEVSKTLFSEVADAFENSNYEQALVLLITIKKKGVKSRFIDIDALIQKAKRHVRHQRITSTAEIEYQQIAELIKRPATRQMGAKAFSAFRKDYPDYDPENLMLLSHSRPSTRETEATALIYKTRTGNRGRVALRNRAAKVRPTSTAVPVEWVFVPTVSQSQSQKQKSSSSDVEKGFFISKYPVTAAQYYHFVTHPRGFLNEQWWSFTPVDNSVNILHESWKQLQHSLGGKVAPSLTRPMVNVSWYQAIAYCRWLSNELGKEIQLPTESDWAIALQSNSNKVDSWAIAKKPWLTEHNVIRFPEARSAQELLHFESNVWEWCMDSEKTTEDSTASEAGQTRYIVRGGNWREFNESKDRFALVPHATFETVGFRLVMHNHSV